MIIFAFLLTFWFSYDIPVGTSHACYNSAEATPQIISRYNPEQQSLAINITTESAGELSFQLFDKDAQIVKMWSPQQISAGHYKTLLPMKEVTQGTYMLNIELGDEAYQQVVWVY